jgi:hypothetical protein
LHDLPDFLNTHKIYDSLTRLKEFTVTNDHLKLLRHMRVYWLALELFGAPAIDNKRPYGNSGITPDVAKILQAPDSDYEWTEHQTLTPPYGEPKMVRVRGLRVEAEARYMRLHVETAIALQIALSTGEFRAGHYRRTGPSWSTEWVPD